jgi:hypothetical protein
LKIAFRPSAKSTASTPAPHGTGSCRKNTTAQRLTFDHSDWTPQQVRMIERREADLLTEFFNAVEPLWARLFGWDRPAP